MHDFWRGPASALIASGVLFALLVADILLAKAQVMSGDGSPLHMGETGQFMLLLVSVVLFVIGTLRKEAIEGAEPEEGQ